MPCESFCFWRLLMALVSKKMPKRKSSSVEFKLTAVEHFDRLGNVSATAEEFVVDRKQIRMLRANRDVLLQYETSREKRKLKLHPGRTVKSEELEVRVFEFLQEERSEGRVVRNKSVRRSPKC